MRLFQNNGLSPGFRAHCRHGPYQSFTAALAGFLDTRFTASHILLPVLSENPDAFFTNGDDEHLQALWAREHGLKVVSLEQTLLAQMEHHRAEVFYNLDPMRYGGSFVRKLPGCVKRTICWRAAPSGNVDLTSYDLVVCNFPSILVDWQRRGCSVAPFFPAHDPAMDPYTEPRRDDIDLIFVGGFSRHHVNRIAALRAAASVPGIRARFHLEDSRLTRLANFLPFLPGLQAYRHPKEIRAIRAGALYGRDSYAALAGARIVLNGAIDMAGEDRGNMRCFEAAGCGAVLLTDSGRYPEGFVEGETMVTYSSVDQIPVLIERLVADVPRANTIAQAGCGMVRDRYSKERQWAEFRKLV